MNATRLDCIHIIANTAGSRLRLVAADTSVALAADNSTAVGVVVVAFTVSVVGFAGDSEIVVVAAAGVSERVVAAASVSVVVRVVIVLVLELVVVLVVVVVEDVLSTQVGWSGQVPSIAHVIVLSPLMSWSPSQLNSQVGLDFEIPPSQFAPAVVPFAATSMAGHITHPHSSLQLTPP